MSTHPATRLRTRLGLPLTGLRPGRRATARARNYDTEAGDTLVEVLIAIVVLGVAAVAMLVAFGTAFTASQEHRNITSVQTAQKTVTQQIVAQLENAGLYSSCAPVATYQTGSNAVTFTNLPAHYSAQVTGVSYWTASYAFSASQAACVANGPQLITATVTYPNGQPSQVTAVVDNPASPPLPPAGSGDHLVFYVQPGPAKSGQALTPQPTVEVVDSSGNVVGNDASTIVLSLNTVSGPLNGAALSGCVSNRTGGGGVVVFTGCSVNLDNTYTITATDASLPNPTAISSAFTVSLGPPAQLTFTRQPQGASGGTAFTTQPQLTVVDAGGNVITNDASTVSLAITGGTGTAGASLSGCTQTGETNGIVSFSGCAINKSGNNYTLTATDVETGGTLTAVSSTLNVSVGSPAQLAFTQNPGASTGAVVFASQPWVAVEDAGGNVVTTGTGSNDQVKLSISSGTGTLGCTNTTVQANAGVAKFTNCKITLGTAGTFTLGATDTSRGGVTSGTSSPFTVAGGAAKLVFSVQPANANGWRSVLHRAGGLGRGCRRRPRHERGQSGDVDDQVGDRHAERLHDTSDSIGRNRDLQQLQDRSRHSGRFYAASCRHRTHFGDQ